VLADLAVHDEAAFAALVTVARAAVVAEGIGGASSQTPAA
jgi:large subunit ribosomal protein L20